MSDISDKIFKNIGIHINLFDEEDFMVVRETLSRIGVSPKGKNVLYQSCHLIHKDEIYIIAKNKQKHIDTKTYNKILDNIISNNVKLDIEPNNIIYKSLIVVINSHINIMNMILYYYDNREVLDMHLLNIGQQKYDFIRDWIRINKMDI